MAELLANYKKEKEKWNLSFCNQSEETISVKFYP